MQTKNVYIIAGPNGAGKLLMCEIKNYMDKLSMWGKNNEKTSYVSTKGVYRFKKAVRKVIEHHKQTGRPLAVWQDGRVKMISAAEALRKYRR